MCDAKNKSHEESDSFSFNETRVTKKQKRNSDVSYIFGDKRFRRENLRDYQRVEINCAYDVASEKSFRS